MSISPEYLMIGGVILLMVIVMVVSYMRSKKRAEDLAQVAEELGFQFEANPDLGFKSFSGENQGHLFRQGRNRRFYNKMGGQRGGREITMYDYSYITGGGKSNHRHWQTVIELPLESPGLPDFELRPEHLMHKIGGALGYQDIDFDSHPDFSKAYLLQARDEEAVRTLFDSRVLDFFEARPGLSVESFDTRLIVYRANRRVDPSEVATALDEAAEVADLFQRSPSRFI